MPTVTLEKPRHANQTPPALTRSKQQTFLQFLTSCGSHRKACHAAGIDLSTPKQWSYKSEQFQKQWDEAKETGNSVILAQYLGQMDDVCLDPEITKDPELYAKLQNSMFFRIKQAEPSFRDNAQVQILSTGPLSLMSSLAEQRPALPSKPARRTPKP